MMEDLSAISLDLQIDLMLDGAWSMLNDGHSVMPAWLLDNAVMMTPWHDEVEKAIVVNVIAGIIREQRPAHVVVVTDAWVRVVTEPGDFRPPKETLDAVEGLIVHGWTRDGTSKSLVRRYRRSDDETIERIDDPDYDLNDGLAFLITTFQPVIDALREP
jgi:hypothetical protein